MNEFNFKMTPNVEITELATMLKLLYDNFTKNGFTEEQALRLVESIIMASFNGGKK